MKEVTIIGGGSSGSGDASGQSIFGLHERIS